MQVFDPFFTLPLCGIYLEQVPPSPIHLRVKITSRQYLEN